MAFFEYDPTTTPPLTSLFLSLAWLVGGMCRVQPGKSNYSHVSGFKLFSYRGEQWKLIEIWAASCMYVCKSNIDLVVVQNNGKYSEKLMFSFDHDFHTVTIASLSLEVRRITLIRSVDFVSQIPNKNRCFAPRPNAQCISFSVFFLLKFAFFSVPIHETERGRKEKPRQEGPSETKSRP